MPLDSAADPADLAAAAAERYARQLLLPEIGLAGQARLAAAGALVVGAGGLGSAALYYLAAAGIGRLGIADGDRVAPSNLNRQILHGARDVGRRKVESAAEKLAALNPAVRLELFPERLAAGNVGRVIAAYDVVLDCTDNFPARYLLNDACFRGKKPLVTAAVHGWRGQLFTLLPEGGKLTTRTPGAPEFNPRTSSGAPGVPPGVPVVESCGGGGGCWRCLAPEPPPEGDGAILGATAGFLGALQALEAVQLLAGAGAALGARLLLADGRRMAFRTIGRPRDPACPLCGAGR
jgi:adenylyltransferase/sulfurtransferase